jgi:molybdenum-dependent DNA-binding transcriptional regulator ModE
MASQVRGHVGLSRKQDELIAALLTAGSIEEAAQHVGLGYRTVHRWLREDGDFQDAYRQARRQVVAQAQAQLQRATGKAVATLVAVMEDAETPAAAKVTAARTILEQAIRAIELDDLEARIQALEQAPERRART